MAFWAFIPAKVLESVGPLPDIARRRDTNELVINVAERAHACGFFDLDSPTVEEDFLATAALPAINVTFTPEEWDALRGQVAFARTKRDDNRAYVLDKSEAWSNLVDGGARTDLAAWLEETPPGTTAQQLQFLYDHLRVLTNVALGGFDLTITLAHSLLESIERSDTFEIPPVILP